LQDLMADGNTWKFTTALGIDADETTIRVAAYGSKNGGPDQFYLLTAAVPEPTGALLVVGAPLLLRRRTNELRGKSE
jgi:hypothetical protein